jgi:CheY-like chemotaxis protein
MAADETSPVWWIEVIKVSPGLIGAAALVGVLIVYRKEVRRMLQRMTKFSGLGFKAEFSDKTLDQAIAASTAAVTAAVSPEDKKGALKRLGNVAPLLRDTRMLWVDDNPARTRNERALLESVGVRFTTVTTSAAAEKELRENVFLLVLTDLKREGNGTEGIDFVARTVAARTDRPTIGYVDTNQSGLACPANFFGITNRPDHLVHLVCDVVERERI